MKRLMPLTLVALLAACGPSDPPQDPSRPVASAAASAAAVPSTPLTISLRAVKSTDQVTHTPLLQHGSARSGELLAYYVKPDRDAYVYILQFFPDGTRTVIFPRDGEQKIPGGEESRVPASAKQWLQLDQTVGEEHLYVLASPRPLAELDREAADAIGLVRVSPQAPVADAGAPGPREVHALAPEPAPAASSAPTPAAPPLKPASLRLPPRAPPGGSGGPDATLLVMRDPVEVFAERAVLLTDFENGYTATAGKSGVVVVHFPFKHEK